MISRDETGVDLADPREQPRGDHRKREEPGKGPPGGYPYPTKTFCAIFHSLITG